ncbi:MAG: metal ABC transporter substrate-binding protein [Phycisphaeraceae bacterium]
MNPSPPRISRCVRLHVHALTVLLFTMLLAGCSQREVSDEPVIVATIFPLANLVEQIVGDRAEVICTVPPGMSPHGFEPTARHMEAIRRAEMVVMVGLNYDDWARDAKQRYAPADAALVVFSEAVGLETHDDHAHHDHDHGHADEHDHGGANPHLWLDPVLTHQFVEALGSHLAARLGDDDGQLAARTAALSEEFAEIDREYTEALAPYADAKIITFHNAFDRMVERYGMEMAATLTPVDAPGALTSGRVERALQVIAEHDVRTVYAEPQFPAEAFRVLENEAGVRVLILDPLGDPYDSERDTFQKIMRRNLETLVDGLGARS